MNGGITEAFEKLVGIIQLQTQIIDRLAMELMQHAELEEEELRMIERAAHLQGDAMEEGLLRP